jgi:diaminopimelate decarboxylase
MQDRLLQIAGRFGTPAFAYDVEVLRRQVRRLLDILPATQLRYSLKANPSLGLCKIISAAGFGADVSSLGELLIALAAGFLPRQICVSGPYKSQELLTRIAQLGEIAVSIDSLTELRHLANVARNCRVILRLRPNAPSGASATTSSTDRFGIRIDELHGCRQHLSGLRFGGFHVYTGTQKLHAAGVVQDLRDTVALAQAGARILGQELETINFGGGFGVPYKDKDPELDLRRLELEMMAVTRVLAPTVLVLELGRYFVAQCGWYLTSVVAHQSYRGMDAVVVDGGTHQRSDLCDIGLSAGAFPPLLLNATDTPKRPMAILGCLCLPSDILAREVLLPNPKVGDVLAFPNAGAYGLTASPSNFLCHPHPVEVAFEADRIFLLRERTTADHVLRNQHDALPT